MQRVSAMRSGARRRSASGSSPRGSSGRGGSRGRRPRAGRSRSTARRSAREGLRCRRLARARAGARAASAGARSAGGRAARHPEPARAAAAGRAHARESAPALVRREREPRRRSDARRARPAREPGHAAGAGRGRRAALVRRVTAALRRRGPTAHVAGRPLAAVAAALPDRRRDVRAEDAVAAAVPAAPAPARALPARRAAAGAGRGRLAARRVPAPAARAARRDRRLRRGLPHVRRGHRPLLSRRAGRVGAVVRAGGARAARLRRGHRPSLRDAAHALALAGDAAVRAQASGAAARPVAPSGPRAFTTLHVPPRGTKTPCFHGSASPAVAVVTEGKLLVHTTIRVMETSAKYAGIADTFTEREYGDAARYFRHRAEIVVALGPRLEPGDRLLDLACAAASFAPPLLAAGVSYTGLDANAAMVAAARARLGAAAKILQGDLLAYVPPQPVAATAIFRSLHFVADRRAFFAHVAAYTEKKLVFDANPR